MKTPRWTRIALILLAASAWRLQGQTLVDLSRQGKLATGTVLPAQCAVGQIFFITNVTAGANLYACTSPNTWSVETGSGAIGGSNGQFIYNNAGAASGSNLSQNSDGSLSAGTGFGEAVCTVTFSTSLAFNSASCNRFEVGPLTANVTSSSITGQHAGQHLKFLLKQDNIGSRTVTWPASFINMCQPWAAPNATTVQEADVMQSGVTVRGTGCTVDSVASSLGTGYLSQSYSVGPTAVVANTWVKLTGGKLAPVAGSESIHGVAPFACAANAVSCEVAVEGQVQVTAEGSITQDHYLIRGVTNPARALDSGQSNTSSICSTARIGGRALTSATTGSLVSIVLLPPGLQGAAVCSHDVSAPLVCAAGSGSGTAYTCATSPTFTPAAGDIIIFLPDVANTASATLSVNGQGAKPLKKQAGAANLIANDLLASPAPYLMTYDGTRWDMQSQTGNVAGGGTASWPSGLPYWIGRSGGPPPSSTITNNNWVGGTIYCYDTYDPYILSPIGIGWFGGTNGSAGGVAIGVFDNTGTSLLNTTINVTNVAWQKFVVSATTIQPGMHSWCVAFQAGMTPQIITWAQSSFNLQNSSGGVIGAPFPLYSCNATLTGTGATLAIPQFGNCPTGHGTRGLFSTSTAIQIPFMGVYQ